MTQMPSPRWRRVLVFDTQKALASPEPGVLQPLGPDNGATACRNSCRPKSRRLSKRRVHPRRQADRRICRDIQCFWISNPSNCASLRMFSAHVEIRSSFLAPTGKYGRQTFQASVPRRPDAPAAFAALNQAFGKSPYDLVGLGGADGLIGNANSARQGAVITRCARAEQARRKGRKADPTAGIGLYLREETTLPFISLRAR